MVIHKCVSICIANSIKKVLSKIQCNFIIIVYCIFVTRSGWYTHAVSKSNCLFILGELLYLCLNIDWIFWMEVHSSDDFRVSFPGMHASHISNHQLQSCYVWVLGSFVKRNAPWTQFMIFSSKLSLYKAPWRLAPNSSYFLYIRYVYPYG